MTTEHKPAPSRKPSSPRSGNSERGGGNNKNSDRGRGSDRSRANPDRNNKGSDQDSKLNIVELQNMNILDQHELAQQLNVPDFHSLRKQELIFGILKAQTERSGLLFAQGVLEVLDEG